MLYIEQSTYLGLPIDSLDNDLQPDVLLYALIFITGPIVSNNPTLRAPVDKPRQGD